MAIKADEFLGLSPDLFNLSCSRGSWSLCTSILITYYVLSILSFTWNEVGGPGRIYSSSQYGEMTYVEILLASG
jgi:hypothetical protein